jgi:hypothetical protein
VTVYKARADKMRDAMENRICLTVSELKTLNSYQNGNQGHDSQPNPEKLQESESRNNNNIYTLWDNRKE